MGDAGARAGDRVVAHRHGHQSSRVRAAVKSREKALTPGPSPGPPPDRPGEGSAACRGRICADNGSPEGVETFQVLNDIRRRCQALRRALGRGRWNRSARLATLFSVLRGMSRPIRYIPAPQTLVEVSTRTVQSRFLLRPSPELNEI